MDPQRLISQSKDQLQITAMHQSNGEVDKAISSTERVIKIYEMIHVKQLEASEDSFWNVLPDGKQFAEKMRKMKREMERLQSRGVSDEEICEKMLEKYEGDKIPGVASSKGGDGGDLSWEATAKQLAEENERLEQELRGREKELMTEYEDREGEE